LFSEHIYNNIKQILTDTEMTVTNTYFGLSYKFVNQFLASQPNGRSVINMDGLKIEWKAGWVDG
jgi:hypothetical protein